MNEVNRLKAIRANVNRRLTAHLVAESLGISERHCRRLLQRYRADGPQGMTDRRRGKPSNYQLPDGLADRAIQIIRERYSDFGPMLACEKLAELHLRACGGELIQIDGCDQRWFEERGPICTLLVYVDDATSRLMQLHFV